MRSTFSVTPPTTPSAFLSSAWRSAIVPPLRLLKGSTMAAFGVWVIGVAFWHAWHGTLSQPLPWVQSAPQRCSPISLSFGLLWAYREGDANMRRPGSAPVPMCSEIWLCCGRSRRVRNRYGLARHHSPRNYGRTCPTRVLDCAQPVEGRVVALEDPRHVANSAKSRLPSRPQIPHQMILSPKSMSAAKYQPRVKRRLHDPQRQRWNDHRKVPGRVKRQCVRLDSLASTRKVLPIEARAVQPREVRSCRHGGK